MVALLLCKLEGLLRVCGCTLTSESCSGTASLFITYSCCIAMAVQLLVGTSCKSFIKSSEEIGNITLMLSFCEWYAEDSFLLYFTFTLRLPCCASSYGLSCWCPSDLV